MDKNKIIASSFLALLTFSVPTLADDTPDDTPSPSNVSLTVSIDNNKDYTGRPHTPVRLPMIALSNHTLYLYSGCDNTTIEIVVEDEMVVYSTPVAEGTETIELPNTLAGTYEIRITRGMFVFTGEIEL